MYSTMILSDLHLGEKFNKKRLHAFLDIMQNFDQIILNGDVLDDFWDYQETIKSSWEPLFDLLSRKKVIYLFGNHDRDSLALRKSTESFVDVYANSYQLSVGERELIIMHGDAIYPRPDGILYQEKTTFFGILAQKTAQVLWKIVYPIFLIVRLFIEKYPNSLAKIQRPFVRPQNRAMIEYAQTKLESHQILVCGHSHFAQFSPDEQFINSGANLYDRIEYLAVENGELSLVVKKIS